MMHRQSAPESHGVGARPPGEDDLLLGPAVKEREVRDWFSENPNRLRAQRNF